MKARLMIAGMRILGILFILIGAVAEGADVTLQWDPSPGTVNGYKAITRLEPPAAPRTPQIQPLEM